MSHFLDIHSLNKQALLALLDQAQQYRSNKGKGEAILAGKTVAMIFEKPSNRTRVSFEVGIRHLGGEVISLQGAEVGLGKREPVKDVARVLSGYVDAVVIRTFSHDIIQEFARYATVPVINGLTDQSHPCQVLADLLTIQRYFPDFSQLKICYLGDENNVSRSLSEAAQILGSQMALSGPSHALGGYGDRVNDPIAAIKDAHVVVTDTWVSMGDDEKDLSPYYQYQVNQELMAHARPDAIILHCLPAYRGKEITDEMIESDQSKVFEEAENRVYAQQAVLARYLT
ncbi:MAG: ornithine carbamoyltransferase [Actinobacteria bacterium]|nr:ornithine carbamoyltransferase [Actinomycetota bacterium]